MLTITKNSSEQLLDLEIVKQHLKIEHNYEDDYIYILIDAATDILEKQIGYSILQKEYTYFSSDIEKIPISPVTKILHTEPNSIKFIAGFFDNRSKVPKDLQYAALQIVKSLYECDNLDVMQTPIINQIIMDYRSTKNV